MYSVKAYQEKFDYPVDSEGQINLDRPVVTEEVALDIPLIFGFSMGTNTINIQHADDSFEVITNRFKRVTFTPIKGAPQGHDEEGNVIEVEPVH